MLTVDYRDVTIVGPTTLAAEASTLGLAPGEWPDFIAVMRTDNEGMLFMASGSLPDGGRRYASRTSSVTLDVLND